MMNRTNLIGYPALKISYLSITKYNQSATKMDRWLMNHHTKYLIPMEKKGVPSAVGFPHCAGSGEGLSLSPKPYPHKCAEAGARVLVRL